MMKGKKIKQINNLTIRYTDLHQYAVWTPDGRCWEDRMTLEQAEEFCRKTTDFLLKDAPRGSMIFTMTCNCYEPMFREDVVVRADSLDEAWKKAKRKMARKHKANPDDIAITAVRSREVL